MFGRHLRNDIYALRFFANLKFERIEERLKQLECHHCFCRKDKSLPSSANGLNKYVCCCKCKLKCQVSA
jgi:hypothetical protein